MSDAANSCRSYNRDGLLLLAALFIDMLASEAAAEFPGGPKAARPFSEVAESPTAAAAAASFDILRRETEREIKEKKCKYE